jgi:hypothetical protein
MPRFLPVLLAVLSAGLVVARGEEPNGNGASPCYAVLSIFAYSEISLHCNGATTRVATGAKVTQFAVDQDGSTLALLRLRFTQVSRRTMLGYYELGVVDLRGQGTILTSPVDHIGEGVMSTCGTILLFERSKARDLIGGSGLKMKPYKNFRCSADRQIVVGVKEWTSDELMVGSRPRQTVISRTPYSHFDLSPNGRYLAYFTSDWQQLCVAVIQGRTTCTKNISKPFPISVSNEGAVLFTVSTDGSAYWKPGQQSPTRIEEPGANPQWLSARAASALVKWSTTHGKPQWPNW